MPKFTTGFHSPPENNLNPKKQVTRFHISSSIPSTQNSSIRQWVSTPSNVQKRPAITRKGFLRVRAAGCHNRTFQPKLWWLKLSFYDTTKQSGRPSTYRTTTNQKEIQCGWVGVRLQMTFQKKISLPTLDTWKRIWDKFWKKRRLPSNRSVSCVLYGRSPVRWLCTICISIKFIHQKKNKKKRATALTAQRNKILRLGVKLSKNE